MPPQSLPRFPLWHLNFRFGNAPPPRRSGLSYVKAGGGGVGERTTDERRRGEMGMEEKKRILPSSFFAFLSLLGQFFSLLPQQSDRAFFIPLRPPPKGGEKGFSFYFAAYRCNNPIFLLSQNGPSIAARFGQEFKWDFRHQDH